jgi:outer membrane receptor protein involved in Fe transport
LLDLSASLRWSSWEARLFVENVTDERAVVDIDSGVDGRDVFTVRPLTYGAQLTWRFQ